MCFLVIRLNLILDPYFIPKPSKFGPVGMLKSKLLLIIIVAQLLLSTSYTKYKIKYKHKRKAKRKAKKNTEKQKNMTVTTSLYAQMFYGRTNVKASATHSKGCISSVQCLGQLSLLWVVNKDHSSKLVSF